MRAPQNFPCGSCGCDEDGYPPPGDSWKIDSIHDAEGRPLRIYRCPRRLVTPATLLWVDLYRHYKNGVLPLAGGLLDQPACYTRAMSTLDRLLSNG